MAAAVFMLCFLTSLLCAVLLLRANRKTPSRLLFWSGVCFVGIALNNGLLFVDVIIVPDVDLSLWRTVPVVVGLAALIYGMIWEGE